MRAYNFTKIELHRDCFPRNFSKSTEYLLCYLCVGAPLIGLYLHRYLRIYRIHFHLNHTKSHDCSQVYVTIGIYYTA